VRRLGSVGALLFATAVALVACQGGGTTPPPVDTGNSPFFTASTTTTITLTPGTPTTIPLPSSHGFSGSVTFPAPSAPVSGANVTITIQNFAPTDGTPAVSKDRLPLGLRQTKALPAHSTILYVGVKSDKTITLPSGLALTLTLPPSVQIPSAFYIGDQRAMC
jgi:hypothetical protein